MRICMQMTTVLGIVLVNISLLQINTCCSLSASSSNEQLDESMFKSCQPITELAGNQLENLPTKLSTTPVGKNGIADTDEPVLIEVPTDYVAPSEQQSATVPLYRLLAEKLLPNWFGQNSKGA